VQNYIDQRAVDLQAAVTIVEEAWLSEAIHEGTDPRSGCANYVCEGLLADLGHYSLGCPFLAKMGE
jgi:hypothetical protein